MQAAVADTSDLDRISALGCELRDRIVLVVGLYAVIEWPIERSAMGYGALRFRVDLTVAGGTVSR